MPRTVPLAFPRSARDPGRSPCIVIGLAIAPVGLRATAVRAAISGRGLACRWKILQSAARDAPEEIGRLFAGLADESARPEQAAAAASALARFGASLVHEVAPAAALGEVLAVGVQDVGLWHSAEDGSRSYLGLCDAALLAERTGLSVIDAFAGRDLAQGGQGGPVFALPQWVLLRDAKKPRVLVDLGRTTRLTYLPPTYEASGASHVLALEAGPGTELLDCLTSRLTEGKQLLDTGGRLAVQGRRIPELVDHLLAGLPPESTASSWHPLGVPTDWFVEQSISLAIENGWSMCEVLCSATHFIAAMTARAIAKRIPRTGPLQQMVITGGGRQNGLLLREIANQCSPMTLLDISELGIFSDGLDAASAAVLAFLHLEQVPASGIFLTGAAVPRVLGRLTPGAPPNWQRLVSHLAGSQPTMMPLRNAI